MKPDVEPAVLGLRITRMSPPRRRLGGTSRAAILAAVAAAAAVPGSATTRLPHVERSGHRVLGLAPAGVVGPDVPGQPLVDVGVERVVASLAEPGRDVIVRL